MRGKSVIPLDVVQDFGSLALGTLSRRLLQAVSTDRTQTACSASRRFWHAYYRSEIEKPVVVRYCIPPRKQRPGKLPHIRPTAQFADTMDPGNSIHNSYHICIDNRDTITECKTSDCGRDIQANMW